MVRSKIIYWCSMITGAFILMVDAFYNGFPIVYSDTSSYISTGFELQTAFDRPITYGLFVYAASLCGATLWFVIFFQSLILSLLIFENIRLFFKEKFIVIGLVCVTFLSLFTGISWSASQLIADIFTSIALLTMSLLLIGQFSKTKTAGLYVLFFVSVATHISHLSLFLAILICALFLGFVFRKGVFRQRKTYLKHGALLVLIGFTLITMSSAIAKSKHVFFMGAMVEHGITQQYLEENCDQKKYQLCIYKDSLDMQAFEFVWDEKSPLYKIGGWAAAKAEFNEIISATVTQPKYIKLHIMESAKATVQQLTMFDIGDGNGSFGEHTHVYKRIAEFIPTDLPAFENSKQSKNKLGFVHFLNPLYDWVMVISLLLFLFLVVIYRKMLTPEFRFFTSLLLSGVFLNAWSCGTFANAIDRLGCRMMWLLPFLAFLLLAQAWQAKTKSASTV